MKVEGRIKKGPTFFNYFLECAGKVGVKPFLFSGLNCLKKSCVGVSEKRALFSTCAILKTKREEFHAENAEEQMDN
jgi:hypothetical protein